MQLSRVRTVHGLRSRTQRLCHGCAQQKPRWFALAPAGSYAALTTSPSAVCPAETSSSSATTRGAQHSARRTSAMAHPRAAGRASGAAGRRSGGRRFPAAPPARGRSRRLAGRSRPSRRVPSIAAGGAHRLKAPACGPSFLALELRRRPDSRNSGRNEDLPWVGRVVFFWGRRVLPRGPSGVPWPCAARPDRARGAPRALGRPTARRQGVDPPPGQNTSGAKEAAKKNARPASRRPPMRRNAINAAQRRGRPTASANSA